MVLTLNVRRLLERQRRPLACLVLRHHTCTIECCDFIGGGIHGYLRLMLIGETAERSLAHLNVLDQDGHGVVETDADEGIGPVSRCRARMSARRRTAGPRPLPAERCQ
jgi:hypothetical protein